jgi:preprotein translocase subunit SecG
MLSVLVNWVVPVIHIVICLFLIVVVLLQTGKGADMGAVFGGGSQTLFGSGGAGNFLTRLTTGTAIAFMVTSLILTYGASRSPSSNLLDRLPAAPAAAPEQAPVADNQAAPPTEAPAEAAAPEAAAPEGEATPPAPAAENAPAAGEAAPAAE